MQINTHTRKTEGSKKSLENTSHRKAAMNMKKLEKHFV